MTDQGVRREAQQGQQTQGGGLTGVVLLAAVISAVSALLYGYDTGIVSGALLQIREDFDTGSGMEQVIAASILLGAVIGALVCSRLSEQARPAPHDPHRLGGVRGRCAGLRGRAVRRAAVGGPYRARLRGRRRHADRADVRRRAGPGAQPRAPRADVPGRHRRRHRRLDAGRCQPVAVVAGVDRPGRRAGAAHAAGVAAHAGEPALAGEGAPCRRRRGRAAPHPRHRRRARRACARSRSSTRRSATRPTSSAGGGV
nr:hypothetical protein [Angustibacter aerolatus]